MLKRYAAAIGILLGAAVGAAIGIPMRAAHLIGSMALVGLIVGYVVSQSGSNVEKGDDAETSDDRLKKLD